MLAANGIAREEIRRSFASEGSLGGSSVKLTTAIGTGINLLSSSDRDGAVHRWPRWETQGGDHEIEELVVGAKAFLAGVAGLGRYHAQGGLGNLIPHRLIQCAGIWR
jgi:hypothetical protein